MSGSLDRLKNLNPMLFDIVEKSSDFFGIADTHSNVLYVNQAAKEMLSIPIQDEIKCVTYEFIHHSSLDDFNSSLEYLDNFQQVKKNILLRDFITGEGVPVEALFFNLYDPASNEILYQLVFARDLREKIEFLKSSERLTRMATQIQDVAMIGGWELLLNEKLEAIELNWTKQTYCIFNISDDRPVDKELALSFYSEEDRVKLQKLLDDCIEHGKKYREEFLIQDAKGNKKWIQTIGSPNYINGKIYSVFGTCQDITEKKQMEIGINEVQSELEGFFYVTTDGLFILDRQNLTIIKANHIFEKLLGVNEKDLIGKPINRFLHPDDCQRVISEFKKASIERNYISFQARFIPHSENIKTLFISISFDGDCERLYCVAKDVTNIIRAEAELSAYSKGLDSYAIVAKTDVSGRIVYANDKFCDVSGYSRNELIGKNHRIVNSGHHPKSFFENFWSVIKQGKQWRGEIKNKRKNGTFYWVDTTITPLIDKNGVVQEFLAFRYDITSLKQTQHELEESLGQQKFVNKIFDISDSNLNLLNKINSACKEFQKFTASSLSDELILYLADDNQQLNLIYKSKDSALFQMPQTCQMGDGIIGAMAQSLFFHYENQILYIPLVHHGKCFGVLVAKSDSYDLDTSVHKTISIISKSFGDLIYRAHLRSELDEQRRISLHSSKLASIGELAAGIGHEINNPLAIIKGYLDFINKKVAVDPKMYEQISGDISHIYEATGRIANIVNGLRVFARMDDESIEDICIVNEINFSVEMVKEIYAKEGVHISCDFDDKLSKYSVQANRGKLQQVFMNLLSNAKDATEGVGNREIIFRCTLSRDKDLVTISVIDNGVGMDDEVLEKIFDPFFTTKEVGKGTGIGLPFVFRTVREYDGKIKVDSRLGEGTTFSITFPCTENDFQTSEENEVLNQDFGGNNASNFEGLKVMIVDDEEDIRMIVSDIFYEIGFDVYEFENGAKAYQDFMSGARNYDLVVTDVKMPIMDGLELTRKIRSLNHFVQPKIFLLTGGLDIRFDELKSNQEYMIQAYFKKPFDREEILNKVVELFSQRTKKKVA